MREIKFGSWTAPQSPVDIEYSLVVIDEIRQVVTEGFQRLSRGGIEVGGVLYGTVEGRSLKISEMRPIACEHARGPTFFLSDNDRAALTQQLEEQRESYRERGMTAVGWFLSHTRSEVSLQESDLDTFNTFFPEPYQVTLVVRPGRAGSMRAGFFVREPDGTVNAEASYQEFLFPERQPLSFDRPSRERPSAAQRERFESAEAQAQPPWGTRQPEWPTPQPEVTVLPPPSFGLSEDPRDSQEYIPYPDRHRQIPWKVIGIVALTAVIAVIGLRYFGDYMNSEPLALTVTDKDGQLQIQWNRQSGTVTRASDASLEISDGDDRRTVALTPQLLATGSMTYARKTGDVQVRMLVNSYGGQKVEGSRYLGRPPEGASNEEVNLMKVQRDSLQDEVDQLKEQNTAQAERIRQLERTLTVLRTRMGISEGSR